MTLDSRIPLLVLALIFIFAIAAFLYRPPVSIVTEKDAAEFVLNDVKATYGNDVCARSSRVQKQDGKWTASILFSVAPNSQCPARVQRDYDFLPLRFREDKQVGTCTPPTLLSFEEEAVLKTADLAAASGLANLRSCALKLDADSTLQCCPLDPTGLQQFASQARASGAKFAVLWANQEKQLYYALDGQGSLLAQGRA